MKDVKNQLQYVFVAVDQLIFAEAWPLKNVENIEKSGHADPEYPVPCRPIKQLEVPHAIDILTACELLVLIRELKKRVLQFLKRLAENFPCLMSAA